MTHASPRHRAVAHRGPSRLQRSRDRVCDALVVVPDRLPSRRSIAAAAVGGVLLTGGAVGAQTLVGGSTDTADASVASVPMTSRLAVEPEVSRSAERVPLSSLEEAAEIAQEGADDAQAEADAKAAAAKKKAAAEKKKAEQEAEQQRILDDARANPRAVARLLLADYGFDASQFGCLDSLWAGESDWDYTATNPSSGAYGIPQSLPATKMATAGDDWETNPVTQIKWGLNYIREAYGTPCSANAFKAGNGFY